MSYFDNLEQTLSLARRKSLSHRSCHHWLNRRNKMHTRHIPRGKAFKRLYSLERDNISPTTLW